MNQVQKVLQMCASFSAAHGMDLIAFAAKVEDEAAAEIAKICDRPTGNKKLGLLLTTPGGDAHDAFRITRRLQRRYEHITVYINAMCKSAGTLIALGGHELVMSDAAELGPLDVQLTRQDEILGEPQSGLDLLQALHVLGESMIQSFARNLLEIRVGAQLSTRLAAELASKLTVGGYSGIYQQIDPIRLGEIQRKVLIASKYGDRIEKFGRNVKPGAVQRLVTDYPSHSFVIDRDEATELFKNVRAPTVDEMLIFQELPPILFELNYEKTIVVLLAPPPSQGDDQNDEQDEDQPDAVGRNDSNDAPRTDPGTGTGTARGSDAERGSRAPDARSDASGSKEQTRGPVGRDVAG